MVSKWNELALNLVVDLCFLSILESLHPWCMSVHRRHESQTCAFKDLELSFHQAQPNIKRLGEMWAIIDDMNFSTLRYVDVIRLLSLIGHLYLIGVCLSENQRTNTMIKLTYVNKRTNYIFKFYQTTPRSIVNKIRKIYVFTWKYSTNMHFQ